eukprot:2208926-Amphidinium_carterae.1
MHWNLDVKLRHQLKNVMAHRTRHCTAVDPKRQKQIHLHSTSQSKETTWIKRALNSMCNSETICKTEKGIRNRTNR